MYHRTDNWKCTSNTSATEMNFFLETIGNSPWSSPVFMIQKKDMHVEKLAEEGCIHFPEAERSNKNQQLPVTST